ncbi:hypothetical protein [Streptomyces sp. NPDC048636]|uniref:hypothetical protein n=1 Tax=Streptomyces sp. NPDC048636 TaxID=3155762 RepID=UPI0034228F71
MALDDHRRATPAGHGPGDARTDTDAARLVGDEELPCGRLISYVWEQARSSAGPDPHTAGCASCRQAVEGLTALDAAARPLREVRPSARTVAERVMRAVRAEARLGRLLPLDGSGTELWIAETAAARVLRRAADRVAGVRAASCRLIPDEDNTAVAISMTLAMTLDRPLPGRATEVRRAVGRAAEDELGTAVSGIDLAVVSVLEPSTSTAPVELRPRNRSRR